MYFYSTFKTAAADQSAVHLKNIGQDDQIQERKYKMRNPEKEITQTE